MKKNILVIDDEAVMIEVLKGFLEDDYSVTAFDNVYASMNYLECYKPDLILMDMHMDDEDFCSSVMSVSQHNNAKDVPFIALTDKPWVDLSIDADVSHTIRFLPKCFFDDSLISQVKQHIQ